jgi:superoxide reductase
MDTIGRRGFLKTSMVGGSTAVFAKGIVFAQEYFPVPVDESLWKGINRLKNPQNETGMEKVHVPVITAPEKVKAGEVFDVDIVVGKVLHPMEPKHWIEYLQLGIGNEPGGMVTFRSRGYVKPVSRFAVVLDESLKGKKISLVATQKCNLHGIWQHYVNVEVV